MSTFNVLVGQGLGYAAEPKRGKVIFTSTGITGDSVKVYAFQKEIAFTTVDGYSITYGEDPGNYTTAIVYNNVNIDPYVIHINSYGNAIDYLGKYVSGVSIPAGTVVFNVQSVQNRFEITLSNPLPYDIAGIEVTFDDFDTINPDKQFYATSSISDIVPGMLVFGFGLPETGS